MKLLFCMSVSLPHSLFVSPKIFADTAFFLFMRYVSCFCCAYSQNSTFGWEEDGLRGHVFASADNSTLIIAIKGTSAAILGGGGGTSTRDKINVSWALCLLYLFVYLNNTTFVACSVL